MTQLSRLSFEELEGKILFLPRVVQVPACVLYQEHFHCCELYTIHIQRFIFWLVDPDPGRTSTTDPDPFL